MLRKILSKTRRDSMSSESSSSNVSSSVIEEGENNELIAWTVPQKIPSQIPVPSDDYYTVNVEVEASLEVFVNVEVGMKDLCQHLNQYFYNYKGEYKLFHLNYTMLILCVSSLKKTIVEYQRLYPIKYKSGMETVFTLKFLESKADVLNRNKIHFSSSWSSLGVNHKTYWNFRTSYKETSVKGIIINNSIETPFFKIIKDTNLRYKLDNNILVIG